MMRVTGFLTIFFVGLKLGGIIAWPWVWVVSPMWMLFVLGWFILMVNDIAEAKIERERGDSEGTE